MGYMNVVCVECGVTIHVGVYDSASTNDNGISHGLCDSCLRVCIQKIKERKEKRRADNKESDK